jgi:proline iminopeptidase
MVKVPGGEASVEVVPGGPARLLWFEGGPGFNAALGRPDVELLSERVTAYLIDAPGAGGSTPPASEQGYTAAATAAFYEQVRRALGLGPVTVAGHSWGGTVALYYAAAFPEACERCLAISPSAGTFADETGEAAAFHDAAFARHSQQPWFADAQAAFDSYGDPAIDDPRLARDRFSAAWPLYFADPGAAASRHHIERLRRVFTLDPAAAQAAMRFAYDQADVRLLPPIMCPVLVVAGGLDVVCGTPHAEAIARTMPHVTLRIFPDCGHIPQYEQPDAFANAVFAWWDTTDAPAG